MLGAALAVALIEGAARRDPDWLPPQIAAGLHPSAPAWSAVFMLDPRTGVRLRPSRRVIIQPSPDHRPYWLVTDAQGFRNPQDSPRADVVAVGDSMTEGVGVPDEQTWVRVLEQTSGWSVANLGTRGHELSMKLATLGVYGLPKRPRIALLEYLDDIGWRDAATGQRAERLAPDHLPQMIRAWQDELASAQRQDARRRRPYLVTCALVKMAGAALRDLVTGAAGRQARREEQEMARRTTTVFLGGRPVRLAVPPGDLEDLAVRSREFLRRHPDWPRFQEHLLRLRQRCAAQGTRLVLVVIPDPLPLYLPLIADQLPPHDALRAAVTHVDAHAELLAAFCREHDMPCIDVTPALRAAAARGEPLCFPVDVHWDAAGHRLIGQEIARQLPPPDE
ncbi:MAG: hypothetical protein A3C53_04320 [Omnitrophica WOR_2 bacterium RIFCSPHIGHO2_02_FULL_68_15]|nr:MAG: hypothetical protein A3C53_04320 [Omnitrophica WOR_2 bacterium RIFCSPHIGHO2_02_FULL_68_15]